MIRQIARSGPGATGRIVQFKRRDAHLWKFNILWADRLGEMNPRPKVKQAISLVRRWRTGKRGGADVDELTDLLTRVAGDYQELHPDVTLDQVREALANVDRFIAGSSAAGLDFRKRLPKSRSVRLLPTTGGTRPCPVPTTRPSLRQPTEPTPSPTPTPTAEPRPLIATTCPPRR